MRKNCFVKISGDLININHEMLEWIKGLTDSHYVVICVGGGTQINAAFEKAGFAVGKFGPLGRETNSLEERQLARNVLEKNQAMVQDFLSENGINAVVEIPVIQSGTVLCHINGDQYVVSAYNGFDILYIVTTLDRLNDKRKEFTKYPKINVISF